MARFGAKRPQQSRDTLPIVMIVCDDAKTAPSYFIGLRSILKQHCTIKVVPAMRHGATGTSLIDYAVEERKKLSDDEGVTVWVLVDLEMKPDSNVMARILQEKAAIVKPGVTLLLSQPCFEVWLLMHFMKTGQLFQSCNQVLQEIKKQWKAAFGQDFPQKKAQADYRKLIERISAAITNAKRHNSGSNQSWTDVWQVVEHAMSFTKRG